jgi:hypothetical protein
VRYEPKEPQLKAIIAIARSARRITAVASARG